MTFKEISIFGLLVCVVTVSIALCAPSFAEQKNAEVTAMATPFGSAGYTVTMAFEETFKKADSWVKWKTKETPGAMYMFKYTAVNRGKIVAGELPQVVIPIQGGLLGYVIEGRPPFHEIPNPDLRALFSLQAAVFLMVTFDPEIKELKDLAGKKTGVSEKARVFQNDLLNRPYFEKGLGIWNKIQWHYLGSINAKDALLNNRIDAKSSLFLGNVELAPDGTYICTKLVPEGPTLELLDSGRKLYMLGWDPEIIKKSYDFDKDMALHPILIRKDACKGIDRDIWGIGNVAKVIGSVSMPDDMVGEMIGVRHGYRKELAKYHPMLDLLPESPYPLGTPKGYVHPGVEKAMKNLGLPIPE
jgi:TRAP-type uncharacterized transport system substrate-binding protein